MDTTAKTTEKPTLLNLAGKLMEMQSELDELTLQLALGKAEVREKYEEIKNDFRNRLINFKNVLKNQQSTDAHLDIISRIDQLEDRLMIGKAENRDMFVAQKRFIMKALLTFEKEIRKRLPDHWDAQLFANEIENFKLKIEILRLKFVLKRFTIKDEIKSSASEVQRRVALLIQKARKKIISGEKRLIHINKEIISRALS